MFDRYKAGEISLEQLCDEVEKEGKIGAALAKIHADNARVAIILGKPRITSGSHRLR